MATAGDLTNHMFDLELQIGRYRMMFTNPRIPWLTKIIVNCDISDYFGGFRNVNLAKGGFSMKTTTA